MDMKQHLFHLDLLFVAWYFVIPIEGEERGEGERESRKEVLLKSKHIFGIARSYVQQTLNQTISL